MKLKRYWTMGIISTVSALILAACGGDSIPTSAPAAQPNPVPTTAAAEPATLAPTEVSEATVVAEATNPPPFQETAAVSADTPRFTWEISTVDDNGAKPSLAVDLDGVPHIAFMLEAMPGFVKHAVLGEDGWEFTTVAEGYFYGPLDIKLDRSGGPGISWHNHDKENEAYAQLVDGKWVVQDVEHPGHDGWDNNLVMDLKGNPHTVSIDPKQFGSNAGIEYATFDGETWTVEEVGSGPIAYEFGTAIALDYMYSPHLAWYDDSAKDLKYAVKSGESWEITTVDSEGDVGRYPSLALDEKDNAYISYFELVTGTSGYIKVAKWDGEAWNTQRIDKLDNVVLGFTGARKTSSLSLDFMENPVVVYSDERVIKLAWWDGSEWNLETVVEAGELPLGQQVSAALDEDGALHLTYAEVASKEGPGVKGVIKYAKGAMRQESVSEGSSVNGPVNGPLVAADPGFRKELRSSGIRTGGWETDFIRHTVPFDSILSGGPPRDGIPPIDNPKFVEIEQADDWLDALEPVVSFELNGDARAYPLQILMWHEIVNDDVGGVPVAVTFCPLCNSAIVFDRRLNDMVHTFGTSGMLRNSDLIMWDRQTETWWQQLTGEGIIGQLAGHMLTFIPAQIISWGDFKAANPKGQVLSRDTGLGRRYGVNPYAGYDRVDNPPFLFDGVIDGRLLPKERVVTVTIGEAQAAFPFSVLVEEGTVNYNVGGKDLVVFFKPGTRSALDSNLIADSNEIGAAALFEATLDGSKHTFKTEGDKIVDSETGSVWSILGEAVEGPSAGKMLTPVVHTNSFWFAVAAFKPDTKIYQGQ